MFEAIAPHPVFTIILILVVGGLLYDYLKLYLDSKRKR